MKITKTMTNGVREWFMKLKKKSSNKLRRQNFAEIKGSVDFGQQFFFI